MPFVFYFVFLLPSAQKIKQWEKAEKIKVKWVFLKNIKTLSFLTACGSYPMVVRCTSAYVITILHHDNQ